ncbi:uncharacterized protein LOC118430854 [Branchiostoma floridae]|uniref:Uncharacterized protein LOC118430854 n=1 Tax=Branchiostoma floridae TaxID=7739 RepID=A0A9J7MEL9_BRAFL|nr:uncharacterized protein LOC118430854 [Branchiostoma floridae]
MDYMIQNGETKWLITLRQKSFQAGKSTTLTKFYRIKVKREIRKAKKQFYKVNTENQKNHNPKSWHRNIKVMCNIKQSSKHIPVPGVDQNNFTAIADAINSKLASVSQSLPPLDTCSLPAFLPAHPVPTIQVWDVYSKLKSTNCSKSPGPDGVPSRILKEFACEISGPICDLMNASFREGVVPRQWKEAYVVPLPKSTPPDINELRPI